LSSTHDTRLSHSIIWILAGLALLSAGAYLLASGLYYRIGFPLDDAWIHQTYARNLALYGDWAFLPGKPSGGSTSPLWSALIAIGFLLRLAPYAWTYLLGTASLWAIAVTTEATVRELVLDYRPRFPWAGAVMALEWHLAWSAVSGMETALYALMISLVMALLIRGTRKPFGLGLLIGLSAWIRPDGITLFGAAAVTFLLMEQSWGKRVRGLINLSIGCGSLLAFYVLFNLILSGSPLPNTYYAKQAEYAILQQIPFLQRLGMEALQPLVGIGIALLPGVIISLVTAVRRRSWGVLAMMVWFIGYLGLYAWRLPVTYQHARYIIPAMTVWFVLGLAGLFELVAVRRQGWRWVFSIVSELAAGLILLAFWGRGAYAYAQDVAVIESEMVATARWVSANVPSGALVAAHDIGALGYFGQHNLVDLAGLISPEVIPFLRDESRIAGYLEQRQVDYLVTFPSWYPHLTHDRVPIFTTRAPYAPALGEDNMAVYLWSTLR
jgi:arabinofuranosyltransferase